MRTSRRFFSSESSYSRGLSNAPDAGVPNVGPKPKHRILEFFCFGRPRSHAPQDENLYHLHASQEIRIVQESRNVYVDGTNNNVSYTINTSNNFMDKLLKETIQGATFDSSARDPPPRCHPGTRLAIIARCLEFVANATGKKKLRWVVGQAGVGKSAIMQNIAESPLPSVSHRASIFLSINGRNDGSKIVITLVYQLADLCEPYRQFVEHEITRHPSLLLSTMSVQFKKFLIEPFIDNPLSGSVGRILIIIDGLDECNNLRSQGELLQLICDVCSTYQSSPIVWLVASRPEHHITTFFARDDVKVIYEKEEIQVNSDKARSDVEQFLRAEFNRIQEEFSLTPGSQWPSEQDLWKLASASSGLFAFSQTVIKYIGDPEFGDPVSQLKDVLTVIDARPLLGIPREQHPFALLDTLYDRILSKVPGRVMANTRKILLALVLESKRDSKSRQGGFLALCNWMGMTCDEAYAVVRHLGSVLFTPDRDEVHRKKLQPFHKSFIDYLSDFTRSGFSSNVIHEAQQLDDQYTTRILGQAPGGIDCSDMYNDVFNSSGNIIGHLASVPGAGSDIVLTWSADKVSKWSDNGTRLEVYKWAFASIVEGNEAGHSVFCAEFYEKYRRHELMKSGILKRVPIKELDFTQSKWKTRLRFRRPSGTTTKLSNPWNPSCNHKRTGDWGEGKDEGWMTDFRGSGSEDSSSRCHFCCHRLEQQLKSWKTQSPDPDVTLLLTSFNESFAEFQFIDPNDGVSEWTYWIVLEIPEEKRRKPGRAV